jgi:peroxiredoxin
MDERKRIHEIMRLNIYKNHILKSSFLLLLSGALLSQSGNCGYIVEVGEDCPDFQIILTDGKTINLTDLKGKPFMLQFTASWCSVCREEMPHIEKDIWQTYGKKGLVVIGVDRDEPLDVVQKFARDMKISYPLALDPGAKIFKKFAFENSGVTRNVLVDRNGKIVYLTRLYNEVEFNGLLQHIDRMF